MFPGWETDAEMKSEEFANKQKTGPVGVMTLFSNVNMGRNLALTFLYFLAVNVVLAYLAGLALQPGAPFMDVFRFASTAAFLAFLASIVQHAIWFRIRITGHVVESIAYAAICGTIFGLLWPK